MAHTSPKKKVAAKPKKPAAHPKYSEMVGKAIAALKERGGSSRQAILKYIMANFNVGKDAKTFLFSVLEKREKIWNWDKAGFRFVNCEITI
jgi:histone H1/5